MDFISMHAVRFGKNMLKYAEIMSNKKYIDDKFQK